MANEENNFENDEITGLLGSLKRVDAPGDFDFRVRARVAAGRPAVRSTSLPTFGKVAGIMLLLIAVAGYFGSRSLRTPTVDQASVVSVPAFENEAISSKEGTANEREIVPTSKEPTSDPMAVQAPETQAPETALNSRRLITRTGSNTRGGGSRVYASKITNVMTVADPTRPLSKDVLLGLGIDANNSGTAWTVGEVKQNSRAERSGLKTGDVIQTVNNRTVRVRRDGKVVQIQLKP